MVVLKLLGSEFKNWLIAELWFRWMLALELADSLLGKMI